MTPGGKALALSRRDDRPDKAFFEQTEEAGIYRLATGDGAEALKAAVPVAALNVPAEESSMARIAPADVKSLLGGSSVYFLETDGNLSQVGADAAHDRRLRVPAGGAGGPVPPGRGAGGMEHGPAAGCGQERKFDGIGR